MKIKNKIKKVSFKDPEIYENIENDKHEFNEKPYSKNNDSISLTNEELKILLENFNPIDYGITEKLSESEKKIVIKEIYEKENVKSPTLNQNKIKNNIVIKENIKNDELKNTEVIKKDKLKKKKNKEDSLSYLDGDCYFPNDGYDYEQHLKPISKNFIEIKTKKETNFFEIKPNNEEEKEVYEAFEMDNLEELNDNFVYEAQNVNDIEKLEIDKELIWGNQDSYLFLNSIEYSNTLNNIQNGDIKYENVKEDKLYSYNYSNDIIDENVDYNNNDHIIFDKKLNSFKNIKDNDIISENEKGKKNEKNEKNFDSFKLSDLIEHKLKKDDDKNNEKKKIKKKKKINNCKSSEIFVNLNAEDKNKILQILNSQENEIINDEDNSFSEYSKEESSYDCETILTTKTNTTNHPYKLIIPKQIKAKPILNNNNINIKKKESDNKNESLKLERYLILEKIKTTRDKNETPEEKKERKKAVKEAQRLNRKLKKENSLLMKNEHYYLFIKNNSFFFFFFFL
ncbi:conserved Plasmodium protein, unknown function [Plasmodium gallinaceum]|uniref:Uncharacterized protein n=1 Tax=Plasmodium gallinaceum TaxID=5849 RepID=A0A1J1GTG9_PLAGA|nr:conserved Plasmodium protein, unknown function [Plasmodium gallinaceum]CRG94347.1 conserved Plasmodium protein, unknown function [Plasmodium gallinaceum]